MLSFPAPYPCPVAATLLGLLLVALGPCRAQDTTFYGEKNAKVSSLQDCAYYTVSGPDPLAPDHVLTIAYTRDGRVDGEQRSIAQDSGRSVFDGISRRYYPDGTVRYEREYDHGARVRITSFWEGGATKRVDRFEKDSLVSGTCFRKDGSPDKYRPFATQPTFKGGMENLYKYVRKKVRYPEEALSIRDTGTVYVQFVVDKDGSISDTKVDRPVEPFLDDEALRVVSSMPRWVPGQIDDEPVRCRYKIPVVFKLR